MRLILYPLSPTTPLSMFVSKYRLPKMTANEAADEQKSEAYSCGTLRISCEVRTKLGAIFSSGYSLTGMNCLIHAPKLPGFLL